MVHGGVDAAGVRVFARKSQVVEIVHFDVGRGVKAFDRNVR